MRNSTNLRLRLESSQFPDLGAMMEGYARAAAELGRNEFKQKLDFTSDSIDALDEILVRVGESPELELDFEVRLWGSYLGEVLRRRYAGAWDDPVSRRRDGGSGHRGARLAVVSADEGLPAADRGR